MKFLVLLLAATAACSADQSAIAGTWHLRVDRSNMRPTQLKNETVAISQKDAFTWHYIYDFEFADGRKTHNEQDRVFDGKERPVAGAKDNRVEAGEHWDELNWVSRQTNDGKLTGEWHSTISADRKTQTVHRTTVTATETIKEDIVFKKVN